MSLCIRAARVASFIALLCAIFSGRAGAEPFVSKEWSFSANFPGQTQQSSQPVQTSIGNITMVSVYSESGDTAYVINIAEYPAGTVSRQTIDATYAGMINGEVGNVKGGTIRSNVSYTVGGVVGHDVIIDDSAENQSFHNRVFIVGDRSFQIMYLGSTGTENSKDALDFLNSFALLP